MGPPALFTEEFCHPAKMNKETTEADLTQCIGKSSTECPAPCVFNNGAELIPENTFCAPSDMTTDTSIIMKCLSADGEATCTGACRIRKGKVVKANDVDFKEGSDLFASNFCHPPTTQKWDD